MRTVEARVPLLQILTQLRPLPLATPHEVPLAEPVSSSAVMLMGSATEPDSGRRGTSRPPTRVMMSASAKAPVNASGGASDASTV